MARNRDPFASALRTLRERAIAGDFSPGRPIVILDEAQALGLSTTPVREALAWLGGEGLIERAPAGGYAGLRLDAAALIERYRLRLHCLSAGTPGVALRSGAAIASLPGEAAHLFRQIVAGSADTTLITLYDRVQATIQRFAPAETRLLGDMPDALEDLKRLLAAGDAGAAANILSAFHERRISVAPLLTETEQTQTGAG